MPLNPGHRTSSTSGVAAQQRDDCLGAARVGLHPQVQGAQAAVDEEAVKRPWDGADGVLHEPQPLVELGPARDHHASDDVGVAAEVLGRRVHDGIGAELERPLVGGRRERVVDRDERAALARDHGLDVDHVQQRVGRALDPDQPRLGSDCALERVEVALVDEVVAQPPACEHLVDEPEGAAVQVGRQHDVAAASRR